jgi:hypothetical protein
VNDAVPINLELTAVIVRMRSAPIERGGIERSVKCVRRHGRSGGLFDGGRRMDQNGHGVLFDPIFADQAPDGITDHVTDPSQDQTSDSASDQHRLDPS